MFARAMLLGPLLLCSCFALLGGCGGGQQPVQESEQPASSKDKPKHRSHAPDKDALSEKGKSWGGWRWKGKRDDCFFVVSNKCFASEADACAAAKCETECKTKPGAPSKVSCQE